MNHTENHNKFELKTVITVISYILFALGFLFLCYVIRTRSWTWLDSDMSSELILAQMLKDEGRILTPNFYYGTELRILYYTQISALLFRFTDSWYMVRVYTNIIMLVIMLITIWYLSLAMGIRRFFPLMGLIFMLPFSYIYYEFVLYGQYYIPCIATSFLALAMILHYTQTLDRRIRLILMSGSVILAVISSLIGYRQMAMFYLPALLGASIMIILEMYRDKTPFKKAGSLDLFFISLADLIGAGIGCLINSMILIRRYPVEDWNDLSFTRFSLERFVNTICGVVGNLGYREDAIGLGTLISNGYSVLLFLVFVYAVCYVLRHRNDVSRTSLYFTLYSACSIILLTLLYSLTDMSYNDRYSAPVAVFVLPAVLLFIADLKLTDNIKGIMCIALSLLVCLVSVHMYKDIRSIDKTSEERELAAYLTEQGYTTGYGTFWHANVLTELSNGAIDMYNWHNEVDFPNVHSVNHVWHWLQKVSHDTERPTGKVFQIFDDFDRHFCYWNMNLNEEDIVYKTQTYTIYGYPSYDDMLAKISKCDVNLSEASIEGGEYNGESVVLQQDGSMIGPETLLYGGTCRITVSGDDLDQADLIAKHYVVELDHSVEYDFNIIKQDKNEIIAEVTVPEDNGRSKVVIENGSGKECIINRILTERISP